MKSSVGIQLLILVVFYGSSQSCDPERKYQNENGECCKKCPPGTKMATLDNCANPTCEPCKEGEYQDEYTKEWKCKRHPYCDPNVHQQSTQPVTKEKRSVCECMSDHHCDSTSCVMCIQNRKCPPGQKISKAATQYTDNECTECPEGFFSDTNSSRSCEPWRECGAIEQEGTSTSNRICGHAANHTGAIVGCTFGAVVVLLVIAVITKFSGKLGDILQRKKKYFAPLPEVERFEDVEAAKGQEEKHPVNPVEDSNGRGAVEDMEVGTGPEEIGPIMQVAVEDDPNEPVQYRDEGNDSIDVGRRTVNGQIVRQEVHCQEDGKEAILSQPETSFQST